MYLVLLLLGIIFFGYFCGIAFFMGHGSNFYFIWLFLAAGCVVFALLMKKGFFIAHVPLWLRRAFVVCVCVGAAFVLFVEGCIISGFGERGKTDADYIIVLGAQMKANGPSKALQYRLDEAARYLNENPDTLVIVSGGQGPDEHITEAQGMYDYLVDRKEIAPERILLEDQSENTFQNLTFSAEFLDKEKDSVAVVSNNFHVFRAVRIARKAGYTNVCGIAARGEPFHQANNMLREFFGVVKDFLVGNI